MKQKQKNKKLIIQAIFLTPFITCLVTSIGINTFVKSHMEKLYPGGDFHNVFVFITLVLFINAVASFASLISYYCLENRVEDIVKKREKHEEKSEL